MTKQEKHKKLILLRLLILCNFLILKKTEKISNLEAIRISWETIMYIKEYKIVLAIPYPKFKNGAISN